VIPALWIGVQLDGIRGAAIAHAIVGMLVALPLSVLALARIGVRLGPIVPALARPTLAGVLSAGVALLVASATPSTTADFFLAGTAGVLTYALTVVPRRRFRRWLGSGRREEAHAVQ
jgi:hypothetical protein